MVSALLFMLSASWICSSEKLGMSSKTPAAFRTSVLKQYMNREVEIRKLNLELKHANPSTNLRNECSTSYFHDSDSRIDDDTRPAKSNESTSGKFACFGESIIFRAKLT
jgi:hypothetical protein